MKPSIIRVRICMVISCYLILTSIVSGSYSKCSCYTFYRNTTNRDWDVSQNECEANGGDLVSMETLAEWEFIKTHIQNRTTSSGHDQWFIGLVRENGVWKWLSNHNLTYDKFKSGLELYGKRDSHAIIEKEEGFFWNVYWYVKMGSICEESKTDCKAKQVKWCDSVTTTRVTTTTLGDSTTVLSGSSKPSHDIVQGAYDESTARSTAAHITTPAMAAGTEDNKKVATTMKEEPFSLAVIVLIVVAALLVIFGFIGMIIICACRRKKRKNEDKQQRSQHTKMNKEQENYVLQPQNGEKLPHDQACIYATVDKTKKTKPATKPEYSEVKKSNKSQPQELNYAVLSDFKPDDSHEVQKPPPYEHTEYAILNV